MPIQKQKGDKLFASDINDLWAAANPKQSAGNGQSGKNFPGTRSTTLSERPKEWWWGKLVADSFADERYTVVSAKRTNDNNDDKDAAGSWEAYPEGDVYYKKVTATNLGEIVSQTHDLEPDTLVQVFEEWDGGSPPTIRYTFNISNSASLSEVQYMGMYIMGTSQNQIGASFPFFGAYIG